jgi:predicted helicase
VQVVLGETFAVKSKNYGSRHTITKSDVDKFLSESNRPAIAERLLMASTDLLAAGALDVMQAQEKPVTTCLLEQLHRSELEWPASAEILQPVSLSVAEPREHQLEALAAIEKWAAAEEPRGQVVMACGTGKSLVAVWSAERLAARTVLVLVPTLGLLRQTATVWARHARTKRRLLLVCSDARRSEIEDLAHCDAIGNLRTTNPARIAESLSADEPLLVVCTYNSSPSVAKAMAALEQPFDLAIADEAHRCAGLESSSHKTILDDAAIPARRRLFFTATPTIYGTRDKGRAADKNVALASMDDRTRFVPSYIT